VLYSLLYDAVALGMGCYTRAAFRVETIGGEDLRLEPGTLVVSTHRADTDVPLVCPSLYRRASLWRRRGVRPHFAAREDVFERGFFAGAPATLPRAVRRMLYPLGVGGVLTRLPMHPVAHPSVDEVRLARALRQLPPDTPFDGLLPESLAEEFRARHPRGGPRTVREALRGANADLLWRVATRDELAHPAFDEMWRRRTIEAAAELRGLVEILRSGRSLFLFPEGRPSPDGSVGPLRKGLGALVRRGSPAAVLPIGVAYDPLTRGRPRAYVAFGEPLRDIAGDPEGIILAALRRATPLTCGQVVAGALVEPGTPPGEAELAEALSSAVEAAAAEGRPVEHDLLDPERRSRRLRDCLDALARRGRARRSSDLLLRRLAREFASAREGFAGAVR
jgi:1-acyl-sn-glycerol-3-phosphate acyltransferase